MWAQAGDKQAFGLLYLRFNRMVIGQLLQAGFNLPEAQDICHDAFLRARTKIAQLKRPEAFSSWLRTIVRRMSITLLQKKGRFKQLDHDDPRLEEKQNVSQAMERLEQKKQISAALKALKPLDRESLREFYWKGHSLIEMSEIFKAPVGTIKRRLHVARKRLGEKLSKKRAL